MCSKAISHPGPGHRQLWLGPPWQHSCHRDAFGHAAANLAGERECIKMLLQPGLLSRMLKDIITKNKHCQKALNASPGGASMQGSDHIGRLVGQIISLRGVWLSESCPLPGERFDSPRNVSDPNPQSFHCAFVGRQADSKSGSKLGQHMSSKHVPKSDAN